MNLRFAIAAYTENNMSVREVYKITETPGNEDSWYWVQKGEPRFIGFYTTKTPPNEIDGYHYEVEQYDAFFPDGDGKRTFRILSKQIYRKEDLLYFTPGGSFRVMSPPNELAWSDPSLQQGKKTEEGDVDPQCRKRLVVREEHVEAFVMAVYDRGIIKIDYTLPNGKNQWVFGVSGNRHALKDWLAYQSSLGESAIVQEQQMS